MSGRFLVLEGIDGCGKTTQLRHLANWLPRSGLMPEGARLHLTREPGGTALGIALRKLVLHPPGDASPEPLAELLLYAADRAQHVAQLIRPALEQGHWVLSDRFSGSTLAYQGYGRELDLDLIQQLEQIATAGLVPDLTFWLELPVEESLLRRDARSNDRIEAEGVDFLTRVATGFAVLARERSWVPLQADQQVESVSSALESQLKHHFGPLQESMR
ncbi:Thymidylate kinase [Prochlorococcus marinus str. MIT 9313]|uniref:Thymidylate kinase n=1 Tax=Prochlorococcus marinus (strain MIT 9313) TaxID=74547 RepID=KTHY_PROMM|nr:MULTISPECIES: dTMP kinase [Prochlorococcus]Q7V4G2.1 RecName: Full=Thymidylate kinase; AltName: Full=dTMP kinase [Prochlorococcus marinus str. MIT 9313]MED5263396.1 dTMP kinase [Cyanobacteriota bacterium]KZR65458.1 Thymidylate kinase [Prochlorococcus marinus str. MIT 1312]KZR73658.1 Thymidylate kinase [Prochlorococcus marinus str. MIT 1320]KZR79042.1 Thymidylate kinase [Prochlorococcus marinus str. MIT 1327]NMO85374.1 dTMP kinase [Prochlorococcus sp. P1344]|tara:strand:+ start:525 stop:1175 length:651 start_codon:yes stop_codon:yes gene_type:complete